VTLPVTLGLAAIARPAKPLAAPRLTPWRLLMMFSFAVMVAALVHVVGLVRGT
jgi:hypothetical protein